MFCPKCGKSDQKKNTYCRQCGEFLPDLSKIKNGHVKTPKERFKLSMVFNLLSAFMGIGTAVALLIVFGGREGTHPVIFSAISVLTVISIWQIVSFFNNRDLKKTFIRDAENVENEIKTLEPAQTKKLLDEPDLSDVIPASVTENTTKNLKQKVKRST